MRAVRSWLEPAFLRWVEGLINLQLCLIFTKVCPLLRELLNRWRKPAFAAGAVLHAGGIPYGGVCQLFTSDLLFVINAILYEDLT